MTSTYEGLEVGRNLTPGCRRAVEQELGFVPNPGRGVYYGKGQNLGKRFRMVPELGLTYQCGLGEFEIPAASIAAMSNEVQDAFVRVEYADYHARVVEAVDSEGSEEFLMLLTLVLCLEEDPLMYRLLAHAQASLDECPELLVPVGA